MRIFCPGIFPVLHIPSDRQGSLWWMRLEGVGLKVDGGWSNFKLALSGIHAAYTSYIYIYIHVYINLQRTGAGLAAGVKERGCWGSNGGCMAPNKLR